MENPKKLKKELKLLDVFAIATGTTLSAGFFLLPGLAAQEIGPTIVLAYIIAALPLIPAMFSAVELATAMPRAGGVYYFLDRSLGPMIGSIGGIGTWLALILKVAFALVGMGAYIALFFPQLPMKPVAIALALALGVLNMFGAKKSGNLQVFLVFSLLACLMVFLGGGAANIEPEHFRGFFDPDYASILSTAGLVYISYVGVTKVASLSEEVDNPERNLPLGVFMALGAAILIYAAGTAVMVGVVPMDSLAGNLTPVATAAEMILGQPGKILLTAAALTAFTSVANAGALSASRYPLAMSRDGMMPNLFRRVWRNGAPAYSIMLTVGVIVMILIVFDPTKIAKLASAFQLLMFALVCIAVIVMRESRIRSYDPGYKSPLYPWMQLAGMSFSILLIVEMGVMAMLFSSGLIIAAVWWYLFYARKRIGRAGAIYHVFERLGQQRYDGLDPELRGILKEKGLRDEDPFDDIVVQGLSLDLDEQVDFEEVADQVSDWLADSVDCNAADIKAKFLEGAQQGMTPVTHGVALPHLRFKELDRPMLAMVRGREGVRLTFRDPARNNDERSDLVTALFFLASPENNPTQHLRILAKIATRVDEPGFSESWATAANPRELKEALIQDDNVLSLRLKRGSSAQGLIGKKLSEMSFPEGCLVVRLLRGDTMRVPGGQTVFQEGDKLTIIGERDAIRELIRRHPEAR